MADNLTDEEFLRLTTPSQRVTAEQIGNAAAEAPPSSAATAYAQRRNAEDLSRLAPGAETLRQQLGEEGRIPLDTESGLGPGTQFQVSRRRTEEDKLRYLAQQFGAENVRVNQRGEPIVRLKGEDGKSKDVLVNARGLSLSDFGSLVAHAPELAGALIGPKVVGALGEALVGLKGAKLGSLAKMFGSAVGAEGAGALQDITVRSQDNAPLQPAEIFIERGANVLADTAAQAGLGMTAKALQLGGEAIVNRQLPSPVKLMRGPIQNEAVAAAGRIQQRTGLPMELSVGQSTGNPIVAAAEGYLEANPIGAGPQLAGRSRREAQRVTLQDYMVQPDTLPLDEEIGRRGIGVLTGITETASEAAKTAKQTVEQEAQTSIKDLLTQRFNRDVAPDPMIIGKTVRDSAFAARQAFREEGEQRWRNLWNAVEDRAFTPDTKPVGSAAKELLRTWPKDPSTGGLLTANAPAGLLSKVQEAARVGEQPMPMRELHGLRIFLDQQIQSGQAIAGIKDQKLITLRNAITESIEQGVKKDPQLASLWRAANDYTRENAPKFSNKVIATLFRDAEQGAFVGDDEFIKQVSTNADKYKAVQGFFGRSSDEMRLINRNIADDLMRKSLSSGFGDEIDASTLRKQMAALHANNRSVFFGVFGKRAQEIMDDLNAMDAAGALKGNVSARELATSLDPETAARPSIQALLQSQRETEAIYANNVIKRFIKGELPATAIRGEEFVNKWLDSADLTDVKQVMGMIRTQDPQLAEQISRKTIQKFFQEASRSPSPADVLHELQGNTSSMPSGVSMMKALGGKDNQAKLEEVMGKPALELLKDYVRVELSEDEKKRLASGVGILTKGSLVGGFFKKGINPAELRDWVKKKSISYMLASPRMSAWLQSEYKSSDLPDLVKTIISSEPFVSAVADDLKGDSRAFEMISTLRHFGFGGGQQTRQPQRSQVPTMTEDEFLKATRR